MFDLWSFLHQTAAASMAALFVLVLQHIFRDKLSPQWQYAVWMVVVLRLILPVPLCHSRPDRAGRGPADLGRAGAGLRLVLPLDPLPAPGGHSHPPGGRTAPLCH